MESSDFHRFFPSQPYLSTANFANKYGDGTDVRYSTYRSSMLVQYSTSKYDIDKGNFFVNQVTPQNINIAKLKCYI